MPNRMPEDMPDRMPEIYQIECQKICQIECQKVCHIECQIKYPIDCHKICQIESQKICQIICQKICQIECQIECQKILKCINVMVGITRSKVISYIVLAPIETMLPGRKHYWKNTPEMWFLCLQKRVSASIVDPNLLRWLGSSTAGLMKEGMNGQVLL